MMTMNKTRKKWPRLYGKSKNDKIKVWDIWIETLQGEVLIRWRSGYEAGTLTYHSKLIIYGKNKGKSNETTPYEQAILEAQSKWNKKRDKGMVVSKNQFDQIFNYFPMLAQTYKSNITTLPKVVLLQPKLNGVRCIAVKKNNVVKLYSRNGKDFTTVMTILAKHLNGQMSNNEIWDGELYIHGWPFQRIISAVKKDRSKDWRKKVLYHCKKHEWDLAKMCVETRNDTQLLEFHRYDYPKGTLFPNGTLKAKYRLELMDDLPRTEYIKHVNTHKLVSRPTHNMIKLWHDQYVQGGYEGIIIRDANAEYLWGHRGKCLLKYKEFIDEEFQIIGYHDGTGSDSGAVIWECRGVDKRTGRNIYFDCRPRGQISDRKSLYRRGKAYIGKMLTVRFQERSNDGVPIFPVGISIRDYE